jgi:hypothetical protein
LAVKKLLLMTVVLALAGCGMAAPISSRVAAQSRPSGNANVLSERGEVAAVSHHHLYVLGGPAGSLRRVQLAGRVTDPTWSYDGRWLAVQVSKAPPASNRYATEPTAVWLVSPQGRVVRRLTKRGADATGDVWSPTDDQLAIETSSPRFTAHGSQVELTDAAGASRIVVSARDISGIAWSPDGAQLAASVNAFAHSRWRSRVVLFPATAGRARVLARESGNVLEVAGWWPNGSGVLVWLDYQGSGSLAADGLPLVDIATATGHRHRLARSMLQYGAWLSTSRRRNEIAFISGGDRELTESHKHVEVCRTSGCHAIRQATGQVSFDPAWSGTGRLALVRDRAVADGANIGLRFINKVQNSGTIDELVGSTARPLAGAGSGATSPVWGSSHTLLFVRHDALWLLTAGAVRSHRVLGPLQLPSSYYGFVPWQDSFAWTDATAG